MQQLQLSNTEAIENQQNAVIKLQTWEKHYREYRGAFTLLAEVTRRGKLERDYQCDIFAPGGDWLTYIEVRCVSISSVEKDFRGTVDALIAKTVATPEAVVVPNPELGFSNKEVFSETKQAENPYCRVLEQVNNETVPELSTQNVLQWVEVYTPSKRKKNSYYRYCYKHNGKIHHSHIAGGNVKAPLAISRYEEIEQAIVRGLAPHQIKAIIASWKVEK